VVSLYSALFFLSASGPHRFLHSFPTRRSSDLLDVVLQGLGRSRVAAVAWPQHDVGLDDLSALLVGRPHHAAFGHRRMLKQRRLRSEEHTSELQSLTNLVCRLLLEKKNNQSPS